jgi:hypothetical protein
VFVVDYHSIACLFDDGDAFADTVVFHFVFKRQHGKGKEYPVVCSPLSKQLQRILY